MVKKFSDAYATAMTKLNKVVGAITVTILSAMFLMMTVEILSRSMLQVSYAWSMELSRFGLVFIIFFGGSMLFHESGHISVTLFHSLLPPRALEIMKSLFDIIILYVLFMYAFVQLRVCACRIALPLSNPYDDDDLSPIGYSCRIPVNVVTGF